MFQFPFSALAAWMTRCAPKKLYLGMRSCTSIPASAICYSTWAAAVHPVPLYLSFDTMQSHTPRMPWGLSLVSRNLRLQAHVTTSRATHGCKCLFSLILSEDQASSLIEKIFLCAQCKPKFGDGNHKAWRSPCLLRRHNSSHYLVRHPYTVFI